jgi:DNA-binding response OmpR family regulator
MKKNARIAALLVAEDAGHAAGYELKLEIDGYAVTTVYSVAAAREHMRVQRPHVIFVASPRAAQELVRVAHQVPELAQVPVIALTQGTGRAILLKPALMLEAS